MTDVLTESEPNARPRRHKRTPWRKRRARTAFVCLLALAVIATGTLLVFRAAHTINNSKAGRTTPSAGAPLSLLPNTPAGLLVIRGADREVQTMAVLGLAPSERGGTVIVVPAGTAVAASSGAPLTRLGQAFDSGGLAAETEAVEGFLGVTLAQSAVVDEPQLARLLAPYTPITVNLDEPALATDANGRQVVAAPAGPIKLDAAAAAHLLAAAGPDESELARLPRVVAIWDALLAKAHTVAPASAPTTTTLAPATIAGFLTALSRGPSAVRQIPVKAVLDAVSNPQGLDLLQPDSGATRLLVAQVIPGSVSPTNGNLRFRIVNPTGNAELSYFAVSRLSFVGGNVVLVTDAPGPTQSNNVIQYQDPDQKSLVAQYGSVIGGATVLPATQQIEGIDATIVLGTSFRNFVAAEQAKATTTSSSATPTTTTATTATPRKKKG
jgi:hypothetical protein